MQRLAILVVLLVAGSHASKLAFEPWVQHEGRSGLKGRHAVARRLDGQTTNTDGTTGGQTGTDTTGAQTGTDTTGGQTGTDTTGDTLDSTTAASAVQDAPAPAPQVVTNSPPLVDQAPPVVVAPKPVVLPPTATIIPPVISEENKAAVATVAADLAAQLAKQGDTPVAPAPVQYVAADGSTVTIEVPPTPVMDQVVQAIPASTPATAPVAVGVKLQGAGLVPMEGNALLVVQLAMAASLSAQGVAVDVTAIKIVAIYYYVITPDTTSASAGRRLLAESTAMAECPKDSSCSVEVIMAVTPPAVSNPTALATAAFNSLASNTFQQATIAVSKTVYTDGTAVSWLPSVGSTGIGLASALSIAGPVAQSPTVLPVPSPQDAPAAQAPATSGSNPSTGGGSPAGPGMFPPATPSGKTITARFSFTKLLSDADIAIFKTAIASVLGLGISTNMISMKQVTTGSGRRLLQTTYLYDATIQVPQGVTTKALAQALETAAKDGSLNQAITDAGGDFSTQLVGSITLSDSAPTCSKKKFGHWCLDGKHINRGGIIAIIVIGSLVVLAALAAIPALALWRAKKARNYDQVNVVPVNRTVTNPETNLVSARDGSAIPSAAASVHATPRASARGPIKMA